MSTVNATKLDKTISAFFNISVSDLYYKKLFDENRSMAVNVKCIARFGDLYGGSTTRQIHTG